MPLEETKEIITTFNWDTPSWDLFIFLFWGVSSLIYAFSAGRGRIINILISVYMAKLLVIEAPFLQDAISGQLPENLASIQQLIIFVALFLVLFILLGRYAFSTSADNRHMRSIVFGLVFAFLQIGLLINIVLSLLPLALQESFSSLVQTVFIKDPASFIWLIIPLLYLVVLGKHLAERHE